MTKKGHSVPVKMRAKHKAIVDVTDAFCQAHLSEEYAELCRKLAANIAGAVP